MTDHPITPSPELLEQLESEVELYKISLSQAIARAYAAGADQELEACCQWLKANEWIHSVFNDDLRAARRPKPPSLKQQALKAFSAVELMAENYKQFGQDVATIRRALEALPDD